MNKSLIRKGRGGNQNHGKDSYQLLTTLGLPGVLYQIAVVAHKSSRNLCSKEKVLAYINRGIDYISHLLKQKLTCKHTATDKHIQSDEKTEILEDWNDKNVKLKYFYLLQCLLLHKKKEVRGAGLRLYRYLISSETEVKILKQITVIPLIVRSIDLCLENHIERVHGIRLARHLLLIAPTQFPLPLARALVAIARDGAKERDRLLRSAQAILGELAIMNPQVFIECGGVSAALYGILDCSLARVNEALLSSLLFLLNDPKWRDSCKDFHTILAPFTDVHYMHHEHDTEYLRRNEERELRIRASCLAVLASLRSWSGFITLYQPKDQAFQSLMYVLRLPPDESRVVILDFLYELFRVPLGENHSDYESAIKERSALISPDPDSLRLVESFVVAEAKVLLPHVAKYRPNVIKNYFSLILHSFIKMDLFNSLCHVIITSSQPVSVKATMLLGELLYMADVHLPDCGLMSHALPLLSERVTGKDGPQRMRSSQAITALLQLSRILSRSRENPNISLYLSQILYREGTTENGTQDPSNLSKWLGKDHDDIIHQTIQATEIFTSDVDSWKWQMLLPVLRWPSNSFLLLEDTLFRGLIIKLLNYFKPSSKLFSEVSCSHPTAKLQAEALILFLELLLQLPQEDQDKYLGSLLVDLKTCLGDVLSERLSHVVNLSPSRLNSTLGQYYFLAIGALTKTSVGYDVVHKFGIYSQLLEVVQNGSSDLYRKLIVSCLDYTVDGMNRLILNKVLTSEKETSRIYATQLLRVHLRAGSKDFNDWGIEFLVNQLNDDSKLVTSTALDVLDEALDDEDCLEAVLNVSPSVQHLGDSGQLLLAKMVSSPHGFRMYQDSLFISTLLEKWANYFNVKYVKLMQTMIAESMTQLQKGDDGHYGRRTGNRHVIHDVFVLPHLYGSLTLHKEGFALLIQHESIQNIIKTLKENKTDSFEELYWLKAAIWAIGHLGSSTSGVQFLISNDLIALLVELSSTSPIYSVRGTVFHALCLIATTREGANQLTKHGWASVQRNHQEKAQMNFAEFSHESESKKSKGINEVSDSECEDLEGSNKGGFYFADESEDETETFSLLMDDLNEVDSSTVRKSQTLPHNSRPSSFMDHQRSLSDCAPVIEEMNGSSLSDSQNLPIVKRTSQLKKKLLSSFRRRPSKRRDSVSSRTSNSSTASEKVFSFFQSGRKKKKGKPEGSANNSRSFTCTSDEEPITVKVPSPVTSRSNKLSPIASGMLLVTVDGNYKDLDCLEEPLKPCLPSPIVLPPSNIYRIRARHRRDISESSHEDFQSKNSLRDFLSSSYDQTPLSHRSILDVKNLSKSPSGCSELSSVRSFGFLGSARMGGGSNNLSRGLYYPSAVYSDEVGHPSGQRFLGLAVPLDMDELMIDVSYQRKNPSEADRFPIFNDSDFEPRSKKKKNDADLKMANVDANSAFDFHNSENCLLCFGFDGRTKKHLSVADEETTETSVLDPPSFQRVKGCDVNSEMSYSSSVNSQSFDENSTMSKPTEPLLNRYRVRKEILELASNLSTSFIAKSSESGLLALKHRISWSFQDLCLYTEIFFLLSSYQFRLTGRRFIQELFHDLSFQEVIENTDSVLRQSRDLYSSQLTMDEFKEGASPEETGINYVQDYSVNEFDDFDFEADQ